MRDADRGQLQLDRRGWKQRGHVHDDLAADQLHGRRGDRQQVGQLDVGGVQQRAGVLPADLDVIGMEHEGLRIAQHDRAAQFDRHPRAAAAHLGVHRQRAVVERESKAAQGGSLPGPRANTTVLNNAAMWSAVTRTVPLTGCSA